MILSLLVDRPPYTQGNNNLRNLVEYGTSETNKATYLREHQLPS